VDELNALDPFAATPWTIESLTWLIDTLGIANNFLN
jgi:hypothetical protein